jgi:pimeloyl-ACP methyl ester carboxylesterase
VATIRFLHAPPPRPGAARRAGDDYGARATPDWREIDWSEHVRDITIEGRRVRYCDFGSGDGPPVVMIHGLGGSWQNWLENIPRVGQERRVIAVDLPGHGDSEMPVEKMSISGFGRTVDTLCERLELGPVVLVGNSMGGFTAAEVAIQFPARARGLVLVSAAGITITNMRRQPTLTGARLVAMVGTWTATRADRLVTRRRIRPLLYGTFIRHSTRIPSDLLYEITQSSGKRGWLDALDALTSYDFRDRLPDIRCSTLIVWGAEDMLVPVRDAHEFERLIPQARKVVFDDTGHVAMIERPPTFNDTLVEFLSEGLDSPALVEEDERSDEDADVGDDTDAGGGRTSDEGESAAVSS